MGEMCSPRYGYSIPVRGRPSATLRCYFVPFLYSLLTRADSLSWSKLVVLGSPPPPRSFHSASLLGSHIFIFGGWNHSQSAPAAFDDVSALDTGTGAWHSIQCSGQAPSERYGHGAVALAADHLLFFGGCDIRKCASIKLFISMLQPLGASESLLFYFFFAFISHIEFSL